MPDIILAINPSLVELIFEGRKTIEIRRCMPTKLNPGDTVYFYYNSQRHGHATVKNVLRKLPNPPPDYFLSESCLNLEQFQNCTSGARSPGAIMLSDPVRYNSPKQHIGPFVQNFIYTI